MAASWHRCHGKVQQPHDDWLLAAPGLQLTKVVLCRLVSLCACHLQLNLLDPVRGAQARATHSAIAGCRARYVGDGASRDVAGWGARMYSQPTPHDQAAKTWGAAHLSKIPMVAVF